MRLRSVVLSVAVAGATAVALPSSAVAGSEQCTLVLPSKVVVDSRSEQIPVRLGTNCARAGAVAAYWDVAHGSGQYWEAYYDEQGPTDTLVQSDQDAMGRYVGYRGGAWTADAPDDEPDLTQNQPVMHVKCAARFLSTVKRSTSGALTWSVTAQQRSGRAHAYVGRPKVNVGLFHLAPGSSTWRYVKSVTATSTGRATVTMSAPKSGSYRLAVGETPTVWASYTNAVRGRI